MALPEFDMRQLLEAGVHFGHKTHRWNPKMAPYIFGDRNGVHIIDLSQTTPLLHQALVAVRDTVAGGGRVLFVGTKRQASDVIATAAQQCAQYYMNSRWLGGTLTNWKTISNSIKRLRELEGLLGEEEATGLTKKEMLNLTRERNKLERAIGGVKDMGGVPDIIIVVDTNKEAIAVAEARTLGIPVVAVLDSNCDPDGIAYPIPGNDDATRAIELYCDLLAKAVIDGIEQGQTAAGVDLGAQEAPTGEDLSAAEADAEATPPVTEKAEEKPKADAGAKADAKPEVKVEVKPKAKTKAKPKAKPAAKSTAKPKAKAEPKAKVKAEPKEKATLKTKAKAEKKPAKAKAEKKAEEKPAEDTASAETPTES